MNPHTAPMRANAQETVCPRMLIVGNWKMNGAMADVEDLASLAVAAGAAPRVEVVVCPPYTLLCMAGHHGLKTGAQDCHQELSGSYTGSVSAPIIKAAGAEYVLVGHSERRSRLAETDGDVRAKAVAAGAAGLIPIVCVGETSAERAAGRTQEVVTRQVRALTGALPRDPILAYEPVWAIGTGRRPTNAEVADTLAFIRSLAGADTGGRGAARLLYGGSVTCENASDLLMVEGVDGLLIGGASLPISRFAAVVAQAHRCSLLGCPATADSNAVIAD